MSITLKLPKLRELKPRIAVIGVGGAGGNAINNMIATGLQGVSFVAANTDAQALLASSAEHRIQLGVHLTEGLGAGSRPEIGEAAAEEAAEEIRSHVAGAHMVFIAAGMGGGTGTGAAAVIARIAREEKALAVGIVTKPFQFEGARRMRVAEAGIVELKKHVDTLIVIPNQNLFRIANEKTTFAEAFVLADQVLYSGIACIVDVIVREGLINLDFADVRAVLEGMGNAMMGMGEAEGERRALEAAEEAIANPLLDDVSLSGAKGLLISITGGRDLTLYEVDEAASRIRQEVDPEANIIMGATFDEGLESRVRVSIVASGMGQAAVGTAPASGGQAGTGAPPPPAASAAGGAAAAATSGAAASNATGGAAYPPAPPHLPGTPANAVASAEATGGAETANPYEGQELQRRLSAAFEGEAGAGAGAPPQAGGPLVFDPRQNSAGQTNTGQTWRGPGDVTVEEGLPQFVAAAHLLPAAGPPQGGPYPGHVLQTAPGTGPQGFQPAAPADIRRPLRRMPDLEDFPAVGQREFRAKAPNAAGEAGGGGGAAAQGDRKGGARPREAVRKPGFFERLTGRAKRGDSASGTDATPVKASAQEARKAPHKAPVRQDQSGVQAGSAKRAVGGGEPVDLPGFFDGRKR